MKTITARAWDLAFESAKACGQSAARVDVAHVMRALDEYQATIEARLLKLEAQPGAMSATMKPHASRDGETKE